MKFNIKIPFFLFCILGIIIFSTKLLSQPDYISFQSVIRDGNNKLINNKFISVRLTLLRNSISGSMLYRESHFLTTNANGIATLLIGNGVSDIGTFQSVDWANNNVFVKVEFDTSNSNKYTEVGTTQLLSVPYAMVAKTAKNASEQVKYNAGDGIAIQNNTVANTKPDKEVSILGIDGLKVQGSYPNFIIGGAVNGGTQYQAGNGISIQNNIITNTSPDKILTLNGNKGIQISGNYPAYTIELASTNIGLNAIDSSNVLIKGADIISHNKNDNTLNTVGSKLLWFGDKAAFRAGWSVIYDDSTNDVYNKIWNCDSIGVFSAAFGNSNYAKGIASLAGGKYNRVIAENGFASGYKNEVSGNNSTSFGTENLVSGANSLTTGTKNTITGSNSISTGLDNYTTSSNAFSVGTKNLIEGANVLISGSNNKVYGINSAALGFNNMVTSGVSVALGGNNKVSGDFSIAIGESCQATSASTIAIGAAAVASGSHSVAIGSNANTNNKTGAMVLTDSKVENFFATSDNELSMRFEGGYRLFTNSNLTHGALLKPNDNAWSVVSDSNMKENFLLTDGAELIDKMLNLKLGTWNYKGNSKRHYGAMAQEVFNAFGKDKIGTIGDESSINSADIDGIMLIAIQELIKQNKTQQDTIDTLLNEIETLKKLIDK